MITLAKRFSDMPRFPLAATAAVVVLAGVVSAQSAAQPLATTTSSAIPDGFHLVDGDVLVHDASGTRFPATLAGFTRVKQWSSDPKGESIAIEYWRSLTSGTVTARVSLIHIEQMPASDHYAIMKPMAESYFHDVHPLSEGPVAIAGVPPGTVWRGEFTGTREGIGYRFSMTTVDLGYWDARVVTAAPLDAGADALQQLDQLIADLRKQSPLTPSP